MVFIFAKSGFGQPLIFFFISNFRSRYVLKTDRKCKKHPNRICYICGHMVLTDRQAKITNFVEKKYQACFGVELGDQDKPFSSYICCKACGENLLDWRNKKRKSMPFGVPMVWRERSRYRLLLFHDKSKVSIARTSTMFSTLVFHLP